MHQSHRSRRECAPSAAVPALGLGRPTRRRQRPTQKHWLLIFAFCSELSMRLNHWDSLIQMILMLNCTPVLYTKSMTTRKPPTRFQLDSRRGRRVDNKPKLWWPTKSKTFFCSLNTLQKIQCVIFGIRTLERHLTTFTLCRNIGRCRSHKFTMIYDMITCCATQALRVSDAEVCVFFSLKFLVLTFLPLFFSYIFVYLAKYIKFTFNCLLIAYQIIFGLLLKNKLPEWHHLFR